MLKEEDADVKTTGAGVWDRGAVSGYRLVFESVSIGVLFALGGYYGAILVINRLCPQFCPTLEGFSSFSDTGPAIFSISIGLFVPHVLNPFFDKNEMAVRAARNMGRMIEPLLIESMQHTKPIEVSLKSRKSYIGYVAEIVGPGQLDISVIPLASGYRKEDTQQLEITTNYVPVLISFAGAGKWNKSTDFRVVIRMSEIVSARLSDLDVYKFFQTYSDSSDFPD